MTDQLTPLQCPSCGGLLRGLDAQVWQCAYCESRYMLLGEETPDTTGMIVFGELSELQVAQLEARMAIDSFNRTVGRAPILVGEGGPEFISVGTLAMDAWPTHIGVEA